MFQGGQWKDKQAVPLQWRHNGRDSVSNHQPHHCLLNRLFRRKSKKTSMLRVTGLCSGNSPGTGEFPAQMASYAENVSIWWRHMHRQTSWVSIIFIDFTRIWRGNTPEVKIRGAVQYRISVQKSSQISRNFIRTLLFKSNGIFFLQCQKVVVKFNV